jgi:hypothetical protein
MTGVVLAGSSSLGAGTAVAATAAVPAQDIVLQPLRIDPNNPHVALLTASYICSDTAAPAAHLWISVKQAAGGVRDPRLKKEGSSRFANAWSQRHPVDFFCDGQWHTRTFRLTQDEQGFGTLTPGVVWVQFCLTDVDGPPLFDQFWGSIR